jgi:hypothetical protein
VLRAVVRLARRRGLYEGKRIATYSFSPNQPVDSLELRNASGQKGAILSLADVGIAGTPLRHRPYQDVSVDAELSADGVILRFITQQLVCGRVSASAGSDPPNAGQLWAPRV